MLFWYLRISRSATVPGRKRWGFFMPPPLFGADLRATLLASCLRGALPPVDLRAVCFVRAIFDFTLWSLGEEMRGRKITPERAVLARPRVAAYIPSGRNLRVTG